MCRCQASPLSPFFQQRRHHLLVCYVWWIGWWLLLCSVHLLFSFPSCTSPYFPVLLSCPSLSQNFLIILPISLSLSIPVLVRSVPSLKSLREKRGLQAFPSNCSQYDPTSWGETDLSSFFRLRNIESDLHTSAVDLTSWGNTEVFSHSKDFSLTFKLQQF